jgi:hypothetical protein
MKRLSTSGKCELCGGAFSKGSMKRHLQKCKQPKSTVEGAGKESFHIVVQGGYRNIYWLHLAVPWQVPLRTLDQFLRAKWLECCGHMSAFTIAGQRYAAMPMDDLDGEITERSMNVPVRTVLRVGAKFLHEYDYGSTTELSLEVAGVFQQDEKLKGIHLLAQNLPPEIPCGKCGANATQICSQCAWSGGGWLCDACVSKHKCGEEMLLPVVNSPRVGVCGYTG